MSSLISLSSILSFSVHTSCMFLVKFILKSFILFDAVLGGIIFLISVSNCLLLVYRNAPDF